MKYVIFSGALPTPVIFPEWIPHKEIANGKPVSSAGFCRLKDGRVITWGCSQGLSKAPAEDDQQLLTMYMEKL